MHPSESEKVWKLESKNKGRGRPLNTWMCVISMKFIDLDEQVILYKNDYRREIHVSEPDFLSCSI